MSANPALCLIGFIVILVLIFTNKKLRAVAAGLFGFFFIMNIMLSHPDVVTDALEHTVQPVTKLWNNCQDQMDTGSKTCHIGLKEKEG